MTVVAASSNVEGILVTMKPHSGILNSQAFNNSIAYYQL